MRLGRVSHSREQYSLHAFVESVLGYWKRHQKKDIERVLQQLHEHKFRIEDPPTYYTVKCPCGKHQKQVHLTPSSPYHGNHVLTWAQHLPCWTTDEEGGNR